MPKWAIYKDLRRGVFYTPRLRRACHLAHLDMDLFFSYARLISAAFFVVNTKTSGGIVSTTPAVAKDDEGLVHVFTRGVDRAIWAKYQVRGPNSTISWTPWYSLGARTLKYNC